MDPMRLACFFIGTGYILDTCMGCINASEIIIDDFLLSCNCSCGCFAYAFVSEMIMIPYKIFLLSYYSLEGQLVQLKPALTLKLLGLVLESYRQFG